MTDIRNVLAAAGSMDEVLASAIGNSQEMLAQSIKRLEQRIMLSMKEMTVNNRGHLVGPRVNLKQAQQMHKELVNIFEEEYGKGVRRAINGFNAVAEEIVRNFKSLDVAATFTRVDKDMIATLKNQALGEYEQFGLAAQEKIAATMYDTVVAKGSWAELASTVGGILAGGKDARGLSLAAYSNTWANDAVMNFQQQVHLKKARDAGLVMFLYYGNIIGQSRPFCIDRAGKVYSQKVIEGWSTLTWQGKSGPPLTHRGGYNCRHHWQPVKKDWVPEGAIEVGDYFDETGKKIVRGTPPTGPKTPAPKPKPKPKPAPKKKAGKKLPGTVTYTPGATMDEAQKNTRRLLTSPLATSPHKYVRIGTGSDKGAYYFRYMHEDWPGYVHNASYKQKTAWLHGRSRIHKSFDKDTVEGINWKLAELQNRSASMGLPPLRAINAAGLSEMGDASTMASMGDGVLTFNAKHFNKYFAGWVDEVKHYEKKCKQFVKHGEEILPRIEKEFGKRSAQYRVLKEQIDMRSAELTRIKEGTWTGPRFGGDQVEISKWRPKVGGSSKPFGPQRPHNADAYFDNMIERGYNTMDHEYAHHIHQQLFVTSRYGAGNPPMEIWLREHFARTVKANNATRYAVNSKYAEEGKEWFAENYALWKGGRKGLVDPYLRGLMERLDDLEAGRITQAQLKKEMFDVTGGTIGRPKIKPPSVKGDYDISKTLTYSKNELEVIHALQRAGGEAGDFALGEYIDWDNWEGVKGPPLIPSVLRSLRTKGIVKHSNQFDKWSFNLVEEWALKGSKLTKPKPWTYERLMGELDVDEQFILHHLSHWEGAVRYTNFVDDFGAYVEDLRGSMHRLESLGLVKKWWYTPGKRRIMMYELRDTVNMKDIERMAKDVGVD